MKKLLFIFLAFISSKNFINAQASPNLTICAGGQGSLIANAGTNFTVTNFQLVPNMNVIGTQSTATSATYAVNPQVTTAYTINLTGLQANNTTTTFPLQYTVYVNPQPTVNVTYTQATCSSTNAAFNLGLSFIPASPVPNYSVVWTAFDGNPVPELLSTLNPDSVSGSGVPIGATFHYTIIADGVSPLCGYAGIITMSNQPALANFSVISNVYSITCANPAPIVAASNAALSYTWSHPSAGAIQAQTIVPTINQLGTWTVTGQTQTTGSCTATHTFLVVQNTVAPTAVVTPSLQQISCSNPELKTVSLTAISPTLNVSHYIINQSGVVSNVGSGTVALFIPPLPSTVQPTDTYTYQFVNSATGCSATPLMLSVSISSESPVFTTIGTPTLANNGSFTVGCNNHSLTVITITDANTQPTPGGALNYGYLAPGVTNTVPAFGSTQFTAVSTPGTWTVVVKDLAGNCETRRPVTIVQNTVGPNRSVIVPTQVLSCFTPSTVLTGQTTNSAVVFSWLTPGTGSLQGENITINTTTNVTSAIVGNYTLFVLDQDNGCTSQSVVPMQQNLFPPTPSISVTNFTITCTTPTLQLTNSSKTSIPPTTGFPSNGIIQVQLWEGPSPQIPTITVSSYVATVPGVYTMTVKDMNNGCNSTATLQIQDGRVYPTLIQPSPVYTLDCAATSVSIRPLMTSTLAYTYSWAGPSTNTFVGSTTGQSVNATSVGFYTVVVTNPTNGCASKDTAIRVVNGFLTGAFTPNRTSGYAPLEVTFTNNSASAGGSNSGITSVWNYGNGAADTHTSASILGYAKYTQSGNYMVILYTAKGACRDIDTAYITVDIPSKLEVPNVFTPNGDGTNDVFFLRAANLTKIEISIYDRWGHIVYEQVSETGNIEWDGKNIYGKDAASGTYFYILKAEGKDNINTDGMDYEQKGTITLVR